MLHRHSKGVINLYNDIFRLECQRFAEIAKQYANQYQKLLNVLICEITRKEYSTGGEVLHRGYYCPSPVLDIITGNCNRGKLLKRVTSKSKPTYEYGFNGQGNLITVDNIHLGQKEIIILQNKLETGIVFSEEYGIQAISECAYSDNLIESYVFCLHNPYENQVVEYTKEEYTYSTSGLSEMDVFRFLNSQEAPILRHEKYCFQHDTEGFLSQYTAAEYDGEFVKDSMWQDHVYSARIKRKV